MPNVDKSFSLFVSHRVTRIKFQNLEKQISWLNLTTFKPPDYLNQNSFSLYLISGNAGAIRDFFNSRFFEPISASLGGSNNRDSLLYDQELAFSLLSYLAIGRKNRQQ